jgi:type IV pilus assembly protein PilM
LNFKRLFNFPKVRVPAIKTERRIDGLRPGSPLRDALRQRRDEVLGLDIGSSAVKMVTLRKDSTGYTVDAAAVAEIEASNDNNQRKINTIRAIHDCLKSAGTRRKLAVCGVSGPEVAVRDFEFPFLDAEEIPGAVTLEAAQVCPFNASDPSICRIDYQLISGKHESRRDFGDDDIENKTKGILVAATNKLINDKVQFAKEAHLKCVLVDVDGLALLNCFNKLAPMYIGEDLRADSATAILNAGASNMTIAIMGANGWPFIRDMAYAGDDIIEQIANEKSLPTGSVKEILFDNSQTDGAKLNQSLEKACRKVIADVAETLRFYSAQVKSTNIERIFVCGGFALAAGFVELLNSKLGIEAVLWNPFEKIRCNIHRPGSRRDNRQYEDIFAKRGSAMAVAAGLAMRSI